MGTRSLSSTKVSVGVSSSIRNTLSDNSVAQVPINRSIQDTITNGVSLNEGNRAWAWRDQTILSAATQLIDLYDFAGIDIGAGAGLDGVGQALALEEIVTIMIVNENPVGSAGQLEIEPDATNGWTPIGSHTVANGGALRAKGVLFKHQPAEAGFDVIDASNHELLLTANGGDVIFSIYIIARHDDDESSSSSSSSSSLSTSSSSPSSLSSTSSSSSISTSSVSSSSSSISTSSST